MFRRIGITLGDVSGIGPEVCFKALAGEEAEDDWGYLLVGDAGVVERQNQSLAEPLALSEYTGTGGRERFCVLTPEGMAKVSDFRAGSAEAALAAVEALRTGANLCLRGELAGLVTGPVNKEAIIRGGLSSFTGQTEFLSELAGANATVMMLLGQDDRGRWLRVALVTTHLPLSQVPGRVTREKVELAIELAAEACGKLGLGRARVGVCGLNPHAGEGGTMGTEELTVIGPAIEAVKARGVEASGPFGADTLFYHAYQGRYEAVVAMYHDQGLGPLKLIGFDRGVNWTLGLPFARTSPDHGTAYDIVGKGVANPTSMRAAISLGKRLASSNLR